MIHIWTPPPARGRPGRSTFKNPAQFGFVGFGGSACCVLLGAVSRCALARLAPPFALAKPRLSSKRCQVQKTSTLQIVLVTAPDLRIARKLAGALLKNRLAACVNLIPQIESHYRWQGKLERSPEVLLLIKTSRRRLTALEKLVLKLHPYDTPEIIALPLSAGNSRYLDWISDNVS